MSEPNYPEAEKWAKVHDHAVAITGFMQWIDDKYGDVEYWQRPKLEDLLYEYYEIDSKKLEEERRAMLASLGNS